MLTRTELQEIADLMCASEKIPPVAVKVKATRRGYAHGRGRWVSVPFWATKEVDEYTTYYLIHEVCHVVSGDSRHTPKFRAAEMRWLESFGLFPVYHGRYAWELQTRSGRTLWSKETSKTFRPVPWWLQPRPAAAGQRTEGDNA